VLLRSARFGKRRAGEVARRSVLFGALVAFLLAGCNASDEDEGVSPVKEPRLPEATLVRLRALSPKVWPVPPADVTNAHADDPRAAALGQQFFFDPRFAGALLDDDNDGSPGTLGKKGETGKVSCESCHNAKAGFLDVRSPRTQLSLAAGWTRRHTPSLLDVGHLKTFNWDGRRDTLYNQVFGVIESPLEFNSSILFVAQQVARLYKDEYEAVFGPLPGALATYPAIEPAKAGCTDLPDGPTPAPCVTTARDDPAVISVVVNFGKAIAAYQRQLSCGPSRFDEWMHGNQQALTDQEQKGAELFVGKKCDACHSGPFLTDQKFYNVGVANLQDGFIPAFQDPGASVGLAASRSDILNSQGIYSDGDDGRLAQYPLNASQQLGAFKTPGLRCVGRRQSFMHAGQKRSLEDVVALFDRGGDSVGYLGDKDPAMVPLGMTREERTQLTAFLRALTGSGPRADLIQAPR
jgi:cytochrome c peroxidase